MGAIYMPYLETEDRLFEPLLACIGWQTECIGEKKGGFTKKRDIVSKIFDRQNNSILLLIF